MLCGFVGASDFTRRRLWASEAFDLLLFDFVANGEPFWQERGVQALETWLLHSVGGNKEMAFLSPRVGSLLFLPPRRLIIASLVRLTPVWGDTGAEMPHQSLPVLPTGVLRERRELNHLDVLFVHEIRRSRELFY